MSVSDMRGVGMAGVGVVPCAAFVVDDIFQMGTRAEWNGFTVRRTHEI